MFSYLTDEARRCVCVCVCLTKASKEQVSVILSFEPVTPAQLFMEQSPEATRKQITSTHIYVIDV